MNEQLTIDFPGYADIEVISSRPANPAAPAMRAVREPAKDGGKVADRLEAMATKMQADVDNKLADRVTNTPRQQYQAANTRADGEHLRRTQQALFALAKLHRAGKVPEILAKATTKKKVHELTRAEMIRSTGYYMPHVDTGKPKIPASKESIAVWALLTGKSDEEKHADKLRAATEELKFCKIPGYFPTPNAVIDVMLDYANIGPADVICEPSAGDGAIVGRLPEDNLTVVYEINPRLCEILKLRGYDAHPMDFLLTDPDLTGFDKILMNPPFEKLADIDHVYHAFDRLKQGGRLVSVMSPGAFFRSDKKCKLFQAFVERHGGEVIDLPDGSFKESGTSINTVLLIMDKE